MAPAPSVRGSGGGASVSGASTGARLTSYALDHLLAAALGAVATAPPRLPVAKNKEPLALGTVAVNMRVSGACLKGKQSGESEKGHGRAAAAERACSTRLLSLSPIPLAWRSRESLERPFPLSLPFYPLAWLWQFRPPLCPRHTLAPWPGASLCHASAGSFRSLSLCSLSLSLSRNNNNNRHSRKSPAPSSTFKMPSRPRSCGTTGHGRPCGC